MKNKSILDFSFFQLNQCFHLEREVRKLSGRYHKYQILLGAIKKDVIVLVPKTQKFSDFCMKLFAKQELTL